MNDNSRIFLRYGRGMEITRQRHTTLQSNSPLTHVLCKPGYCSLPRRLLVMIYDAVILFGLLILGSALALPFGETQKIAFQDVWFTLWLLLICFAYLCGCWHYGGMTVGMRAWHVNLISSDGGIVPWPRCVLRFLVGMVSLAAFGLGFVWALFDRQKRGWHDIAGHTVLIKAQKSPGK